MILTCERAGCGRELDTIYGARVSMLYREVVGYLCPLHEGRWKKKWDSDDAT